VYLLTYLFTYLFTHYHVSSVFFVDDDNNDNFSFFFVGRCCHMRWGHRLAQWATGTKQWDNLANCKQSAAKQLTVCDSTASINLSFRVAVSSFSCLRSARRLLSLESIACTAGCFLATMCCAMLLTASIRGSWATISDSRAWHTQYHNSSTLWVHIIWQSKQQNGRTFRGPSWTVTVFLKDES